MRPNSLNMHSIRAHPLTAAECRSLLLTTGWINMSAHFSVLQASGMLSCLKKNVNKLRRCKLSTETMRTKDAHRFVRSVLFS